MGGKGGKSEAEAHALAALCLHAGPSAADLEEARARAASPTLSPEDFAEFVCGQGVGPLAASLLERVASAPRWSDALERLRDHRRRCAALQALALRQARAACAALDRAGVAALVLKGPVLAARLYGGGLRPYGDLDLLVRPADALAALDALRALGYRAPELPRAGLAARLVRWGPGELALEPPPGALLPLDLHWHLADPSFPFPLSAEAALGRSVPCEGLRALAFEDALVFLAHHAAKHAWQRLLWFADLARLLERSHELRWARVEELVRAGRLRRPLSLTFALLRELTGRPLPAELAAIASPDAPEVRRLLPGARRLVGAPPAGPAQVRHLASLLERRRDRLRLLRDVLLRPHRLEWEACALPEGLYPLYAGIKLLRLLGKHLGRSLGAAPRRSATASLHRSTRDDYPAGSA